MVLTSSMMFRITIVVIIVLTIWLINNRILLITIISTIIIVAVTHHLKEHQVFLEHLSNIVCMNRWMLGIKRKGQLLRSQIIRQTKTSIWPPLVNVGEFLLTYNTHTLIHTRSECGEPAEDNDQHRAEWQLPVRQPATTMNLTNQLPLTPPSGR